MFTGIVEEVGKITLAQPRNFVIAARAVIQGIELGGKYCR